MKFAFVVGFLSATGGMNRSLQILAGHLIAHGHQVDILHWDCPRDFNKQSIIAGRPRQINIFGLSRHSVMSDVFRKLSKLISGHLRHVFFFYYARIASPALERHLASGGYDRTFIQDQHYIPVCRLKSPHVVVIHSNWQSAYLRHRLPFFNRLKRRVYKRLLAAKTIYTVSEDVRRHLIDYFSVRAENVKCAYNPIDFQGLSSMADQRPEINLPESYWLASGRLVKTKRFDRLLKAYAASQVTGDLLIMGKGGMRSQLQALARRLGIRRRVRFIGFQPNPMPYYRHARGVISASDCEGLHAVLLESLACGTPVISANCPLRPQRNFNYGRSGIVAGF